MALTEEQEKALLASASKIDALATQVGQIPGWLTRVESDVKALKETSKTAEPAKPQDVKAEEKTPDWKQAIDKLQGDLQAEKNRNAVMAAVAKREWFEPDQATNDILKLVVVKDGKLVVPGVKNIAGVDVATELTVDEAVEQLAVSKPHRVKTKVKNGAGANSGNSEPVAETASYDDLMKQENARKLSEFMEKYPQKWAEIKAAAQAKMRGK